MTHYQYRAATAQGQIVQDSSEAPSVEALAAYLEKRRLVLLSAHEDAPGRTTGSARIPPRDLAVLSRQMASMLRAGVTLGDALSTLAAQVREDQRLLLDSLSRTVLSGNALSEGMAALPRTFSPLYVSTIAAAEKVGALENAFRHLSDMLLWEMRMRRNVRNALQYPATVVAAMILAMLVLQQVVVPRFSQVFAQLGGELPLPTRLLMGFSHVIGSYWWVLAGSAIAAVAAARRLLATPGGRLAYDRMLLALPHIGGILRALFLARFARMLALLQSNGLPILESLRVLGTTIGNAVMAREVSDMRAQVAQGQTLSGAVGMQPSFSPMVRQMLEVGERTGRIDESMQVVCELYDEETTQALRGLTQWIEPVLTVSLGAFVLFLALAIFMPWWDLTGLYRQ